MTLARALLTAPALGGGLAAASIEPGDGFCPLDLATSLEELVRADDTALRSVTGPEDPSAPCAAS